ncbi:hypothetical protein [Haladaptatus caseinilyticus]|uniref:hypothetical protein n=1 Tax=Haladaptatus caseinilyticus TaxID=2993314 RepID=UPI00224B3348|nr:hypothetical protein [Haladaptatus caseinilyticus]
MTRATTTDPTTEEYELLTAKQKERDGTTEAGTVRHVHVNESQVVLTLTFDWTTDSERLVYALDDARDVRKLESLTDEHGFEFAQVSHLEGLSVTVRYTADGWVPVSTLAYTDGEGSVSETFRTELELLARELARSPGYVRRFVSWGRSLSTKQAVIAVIIVKKILVIALVTVMVL